MLDITFLVFVIGVVIIFYFLIKILVRLLRKWQ